MFFALLGIFYFVLEAPVAIIMYFVYDKLNINKYVYLLITTVISLVIGFCLSPNVGNGKLYRLGYTIAAMVFSLVISTTAIKTGYDRGNKKV